MHLTNLFCARRISSLRFSSLTSFNTSRFLITLEFVALGIAAGTAALLTPVHSAHAQVESPDRKFLYVEDKTKKREDRSRRKEIQKRQKQVAKEAQARGLPLDINAGNIDYDTNAKTIKGTGGVILSYSSAIIEAEEVSVGIDSKEALLKGDVRITDPTGSVLADEAQLNVETGVGHLKNADITFEDGNYRIFAKEARKLEGQAYELEDTDLSTCNCPEKGGCLPWTMHADRARITRDGYGETWNTTIRACEVPVGYSPYLFFPAKTKRQTGLLPPRFGGGRRGFEFEQPFFWAIDKATDATITPFIQTKSRIGVDTEFRKSYSEKSDLEAGVIYLNESLRNGDLQGTDISGLADPTIDTNRIAGYVDGVSAFEVANHPFQFILDGKYVSDDLLLREYEKEEIDDYNTRFVTSSAVLRTSILDEFSAELSSEYNQAMVDNDDLIFQRLPELSLDGFHNFRPFGTNPLGARVVLSSNADLVNFSRKDRYEGQRYELFEKVKLPFHVANYADAELSTELRASKYQLGETGTGKFVDTEGTIPEELPDSSDRLLPAFGGLLQTGVERVYAVADGNPIKSIVELGNQGRLGQLVRVKHTIEPGLKYRYVPFVEQDDNPVFDSRDHLEKRNLVTYQVTQRLFGRFESRDEYLYGIEETTPEVGDLDPLGSKRPIDDEFAYTESAAVRQQDFRSMRSGARKEFANLRIYQSWDLEKELDNNNDPLAVETSSVDAFSDYGVDLGLSPNEYFKLVAKSTFDPDTLSPSSYSLGANLFDKRGDQIRSRLTFVDGSSSEYRQLESSIELRLTEQFRVGYYSRYDDVSGKFIESKTGLRYKSSCNCWVFDIDVSDRENPSETRFTANITLIGLGEFGNTFFTDDHRRRNE